MMFAMPLSTQGSNTYVRNGNSPSQSMSIKYENSDDSVTMPDGKAFYAYVNGTKMPLSSSSSSSDSPDPDTFTDEGGYYKFPNGLIMQWGHSQEKNLVFPIVFPHKCLSLQATEKYPSPTKTYLSFYDNLSAGIVNISSYNRSGAVMAGGTSDSDGGNFFGNPGEYFWLAIGY